MEDDGSYSRLFPWSFVSFVSFGDCPPTRSPTSIAICSPQRLNVSPRGSPRRFQRFPKQNCSISMLFLEKDASQQSSHTFLTFLLSGRTNGSIFVKTILPRQKECKIPSASASGCLPKNGRPNLLAKSQCLRYTITESQVSGCIFMTDKKHEDKGGLQKKALFIVFYYEGGRTPPPLHSHVG